MSKICNKCSKVVYPLEELKCLDKIWHKNCFKCQECNMLLNMKNYKGYDKNPYCSPHYPKAKATTVAETPEMARVTHNTKIQSQIRYHEEFEKKIKGSVIQVANDPETLRAVKVNTLVSQLEYKKDATSRRQSLPHAENETQYATRYADSESDHTHSQNIRANSTVYSSVGKSSVHQHVMRIGSIADYDPVNEKYGSLGLGFVPTSQQDNRDLLVPEQPIELNEEATFVLIKSEDKDEPSHLNYPDLIPKQEINNCLSLNNMESSPMLHDACLSSNIHLTTINQHALTNNNDNNKLNDDVFTIDNTNYEQKKIVLSDAEPQLLLPTPNCDGLSSNLNQSESLNFHSDIIETNLAHKIDTTILNDSDTECDVAKDKIIFCNKTEDNKTSVVNTDASHLNVDAKQILVGDHSETNGSDLIKDELHLIKADNNNVLKKDSTTEEIYESVERLKTTNAEVVEQCEEIPVTTPLPGVIFSAIYEYTSQDDDEVDLLEGDRVFNCEIIDEGWMIGTVERTGVRGMMPSNYVERI